MKRKKCHHPTVPVVLGIILFLLTTPENTTTYHQVYNTTPVVTTPLVNLKPLNHIWTSSSVESSLFTQRSEVTFITLLTHTTVMPQLSAPDTSRSLPTCGTDSDEQLLDLPIGLSTLTCLRRGLCPVTSQRGSRLETHSIYYEVHGSSATAEAISSSSHTGDDDEHLSPKKLKNKMVFIMGLNSTCLYWGPQVRWFGGGVPRMVGNEEEEYTVLVFDHRGVGNSGYPSGPYT